MFRDLKEYQEIQNLYENKIYLSEDEEKKLEESLDFLESVDLSDEDLIYFFENIDQFIEDEELQNISEKIGILKNLKNVGKFKQGSLNFRGADLAARRSKVLQTMKGTTRKPFQPITTRKPFDPKATSFLKKGVSSPPMAGGLRPISSFSPIKDRLKTAAGVALGVGGVTAAAAGISKLKAKAEQEKKQEKIKNDKKKLVDVKVVDNIKKDNEKKDNEKKDNEIKKDNEKKDNEIKKDTTPKNPSGKVIPKPTKPLSDKSPAAKAGISIEKRQKAANMNAAFQATKDKNSGYTKMDFIKDFPNSQTAKKFNLKNSKEFDAYDLVLEYLLSTEQAATIEEANYVMMQLDEENIQEIVGTVAKGLKAVGKFGAKSPLHFAALAGTTAALAPSVGKGLYKAKETVGNIANTITNFDPIGDARKKNIEAKQKKYREKSGTTKDDGYFYDPTIDKKR